MRVRPNLIPGGYRLDFRPTFYLNRRMPSGDWVKSLTGVGASAPNQAIAFTTTRWSVVLTAQGESPAADQALEKLCRTYWWPLYGFVKRQGYAAEEAQDLTQSFFAMLLERRDLDAVRQEKGRLRSYLLASFKNFLRKVHRREVALKRGGGKLPIPLDNLQARDCGEVEPADNVSAELIYERRWALTLLEQVLNRLEEEYRAAGNAALFAALAELLADKSDGSSHATIAKKLGMTEHAVKQAFYRLRLHYRELLREEIADPVAVPTDIEDELRHLSSMSQL